MRVCVCVSAYASDRFWTMLSRVAFDLSLLSPLRSRTHMCAHLLLHSHQPFQALALCASFTLNFNWPVNNNYNAKLSLCVFFYSVSNAINRLEQQKQMHRSAPQLIDDLRDEREYMCDCKQHLNSMTLAFTLDEIPLSLDRLLLFLRFFLLVLIMICSSITRAIFFFRFAAAVACS